MDITETKKEKLRREFKIVVPAADIERQMEQRLLAAGQNANIPGFRPGKAPVEVLRKRFGQQVMGEVLQRVVGESSQKVLQERDLRPVMQPDIEITSYDEGKDLEYTMGVDLMPEIGLADFKSLKLERLTSEADEAQVEKALDELASNQRRFEAVTPPRPSKEGDAVVIDFIGRINGEAFEGGTAEGYTLELGSGQFIPGFETQLAGAAKGDKRDVTVPFPENYPAKELAGKDAVFEVTVQEVQARVEVTPDDKMAEEMGLQNLDFLKALIRERLKKDLDAMSRNRLKAALLDALDEAHDFETPERVQEAEFEALWKQVQHSIEHKHPAPEDEGKSEEELKEKYQAIAARRVRLGLLLAEIGRINKIEVKQEELNQAVAQEARNYPGQEKAVLQYYQSNPEAMNQLRGPLFEDKVVDYILELAEVSERQVSAEELAAPAKSPAASGKKSSAQKTGTQKTGTQKTAAKKGEEKKPAAKTSDKAPAQKSTDKKTANKKTADKKSPAKKAAPKKPATKKTASGKSSGSAPKS